MSTTYRISLSGMTLGDPYALLAKVFPQRNGEDAGSDGSYAWVTFDSPQAHADLGPLLVVEVVDGIFSRNVISTNP